MCVTCPRRWVIGELIIPSSEWWSFVIGDKILANGPIITNDQMTIIGQVCASINSANTPIKHL